VSLPRQNVLIVPSRNVLLTSTRWRGGRTRSSHMSHAERDRLGCSRRQAKRTAAGETGGGATKPAKCFLQRPAPQRGFPAAWTGSDGSKRHHHFRLDSDRHFPRGAPRSGARGRADHGRPNGTKPPALNRVIRPLSGSGVPFKNSSISSFSSFIGCAPGIASARLPNQLFRIRRNRLRRPSSADLASRSLFRSRLGPDKPAFTIRVHSGELSDRMART